MSRARRLSVLTILVAALAATAGCGDDGEVDPEVEAPEESATTVSE